MIYVQTNYPLLNKFLFQDEKSASEPNTNNKESGSEEEDAEIDDKSEKSKVWCSITFIIYNTPLFLSNPR